MIPLTWLSYFDGVNSAAQWDGGRGILGDLFSGAYGPVPTFDQGDQTRPRFMGVSHGQVVVVAGQHHADARSVAWLNEDLGRHERVLLIVHGDEASLFPWQQIDHPNLTWWIMTPRRSTHRDMPEGTRFLGEGAGPRVALPAIAKDLDVAFMGQNTHARRAELVGVLEQMDPERVLCETTPGFLQGRQRADYLTQLARARVAPCPSGATTVDSFRCYEALEVGCVPVVERFTPDGEDHWFWEMVYGDVPFPVVESWDELPDLLPGLLDGFAALSEECQWWWQERKAELARWLCEDVAALRVG